MRRTDRHDLTLLGDILGLERIVYADEELQKFPVESQELIQVQGGVQTVRLGKQPSQGISEDATTR